MKIGKSKLWLLVCLVMVLAVMLTGCKKKTEERNAAEQLEKAAQETTKSSSSVLQTVTEKAGEAKEKAAEAVEDVKVKVAEMKVDANMSMEKVKNLAGKMNTEQLKTMAAKYKEAILAKQSSIKDLTKKLSGIPITEALGEEAKSIKAQISDLSKAVKALKDRYQVYYDVLKAQGGDVSAVQL